MRSGRVGLLEMMISKPKNDVCIDEPNPSSARKFKSQEILESGGCQMMGVGTGFVLRAVRSDRIRTAGVAKELSGDENACDGGRRFRGMKDQIEMKRRRAVNRQWWKVVRRQEKSGGVRVLL